MASRDDDVSGWFVGRVSAAMDALGAWGQRVVVAVSGGPDSVALLRALAARPRAKLAVAHANHALRGQASELDEAFVRSLADTVGLPFICRRLPVPTDAAARDEGIEATARRLRQQFYAEAASEFQAACVATAHTADDQAETVLHRVVRGTGLAGLAGIPLSRELGGGVRLVRPLLELRRRDVLDYLGAIHQEFRTDTSNQELSFTRNRVRHELIPYLANHFNPQVTEALVRLGSLAGSAQQVIDRQAARLLRRAMRSEAGATDDRVVLNLGVLERASAHLVGEVFRRLWRDRAWPLQEMGRAEIDQLMAVIGGKADFLELPGGVRATRSRGQLVLTRLKNDPF